MNQVPTNAPPPERVGISDPSATRGVAASADRRRSLVHSIADAGRLLTLAAALSIVLVLVWKFVPTTWVRSIDWWWLIAAPLLVVAVPVALSLARPVKPRRGALTLDERLSLKDRLTSAIDLHDQPPAGVDRGFAELAVRRAEEIARGVRPEQAVPVRLDRAWAIWPTLAVLAVAIGVLVRTRTPELVIAPPPDQAQIAQAKEQVRAAARVLDSLKAEPSLASPDVQRQVDAIADVERELAAGQSLPADAREQSAKALDRLAQSLKTNADQELAAQDALRDSLLNAARRTATSGSSPSADLGGPTNADANGAPGEPGSSEQSELTRALGKGDLAAAQSAARDLIDRMPSMTADERTAIARELRELASAMSKNDNAPTPPNTSPNKPPSASSPAESSNTSAADGSQRTGDNTTNPPSDVRPSTTTTDNRPANSDAANSETSKPEATPTEPTRPNPDKPSPDKPEAPKSEPVPPNPTPTSGQSTPTSPQPEATSPKPDPSAKPTPPDTSSKDNTPNPKPSPADQRKEQLRRAMEDAARDLSPTDSPRDASTKESNQRQTRVGDSSSSTNPDENNASKVNPDAASPGLNKPDANRPDVNKSDSDKPETNKPGASPTSTPGPASGEPNSTGASKPTPSPSPADGPAKQPVKNDNSPNTTKPAPSPTDTQAGKPNPSRDGPDSSDSEMPAPNTSSNRTTPSNSDSAKPDATKPDGSKSNPSAPDSSSDTPRHDQASPGLQRLADTLRKASEARDNADRDSKLADRLREQAMRTLENASPEEIAKAADMARELAKRSPKQDSEQAPGSVSPDAARKVLELAERLMKDATPEQREKLREFARRMAESAPDQPHAPGDANERPDNIARDNARDNARDAAERFMKDATPEDMRRLSDLARSLGLDTAGDGPGRPPTSPRVITDARSETMDLRDRTSGPAPTPSDRVISDWFDPSAKPKPRDASNTGASGVEVLRRAASGAERSIEQQVVPPQQGDYVRRVFRRYLQHAQGAAPAQSAPAASPATPDAPDAPRKPGSPNTP